MSLTAPRLTSHVLTDHISLFPDSIDVYRENAGTGVARHVPIEAFITGLCGGVVAAVANARILDIGKGSDDTNGVANPVKFTLPKAARAEAKFLKLSGWSGESASDVVSVFIGSTLAGVERFGRVAMSENKNLGTGTSHVRPSANPDLEARLSKKILKELRASFRATGKFAEDDIPGGPVNQALLGTLSYYADALALGLSSVTSTVIYTGSGGGAPVSDIVNTGGIV